MKKEDFGKALDFISADLVEEFALEEERLQKRLKIRRALSRMAGAAACICVLLVISAAALIRFGPGSLDGDSGFNGSMDGMLPPKFSTVTTEKAPGDSASSPSETDFRYVFSYEGEEYGIRLYDEVIIGEDSVYLGEAALRSNDLSDSALTVRLYSLSDSSLAIELDGAFYKAEKISK